MAYSVPLALLRALPFQLAVPVSGSMLALIRLALREVTARPSPASEGTANMGVTVALPGCRYGPTKGIVAPVAGLRGHRDHGGHGGHAGVQVRLHHGNLAALGVRGGDRAVDAVPDRRQVLAVVRRHRLLVGGRVRIVLHRGDGLLGSAQVAD